ncbi:MAG: hypothetical protein MZU91_02685 [Desulfosudis oleivorans]|nr:hypothetical protein [Desulfosudis oleivorans]
MSSPKPVACKENAAGRAAGPRRRKAWRAPCRYKRLLEQLEAAVQKTGEPARRCGRSREAPEAAELVTGPHR